MNFSSFQMGCACIGSSTPPPEPKPNTKYAACALISVAGERAGTANVMVWIGPCASRTSLASRSVSSKPGHVCAKTSEIPRSAVTPLDDKSQLLPLLDELSQ